MDSLASAHAVALWAGLNIALLLILSVLVTRQRRRHQVVIGDGGIASVHQAIRAFGNAAEHVPAGLIGLVVLALAGAMPLMIHAIGLVLFVGRLLHAVGLSRSTGVSWPRTTGVLATWIAYIALVATLLFYAVP